MGLPSNPGRLRAPLGTRLVMTRTANFGVRLGAPLLLTVASLLAGSDPFVDGLLKIGFSAADVNAVEQGSVVVKSPETAVRQELAYFGVVYIDAAPERLIDQTRDIERFERGLGIRTIRRFSGVPRLEDLASLELPAEDIEALSQCRPGDCAVKLSAAAMSRFRTQVNWSSPDAARQANEVAREMILELVRTYRAKGNEGLGHNDDGSAPLDVAEQFRALLPADELLPAHVPALIAHLEDYPRSRLPGADEFFYWSIVDFGLKPTIRVNHVTIHALRDHPSGVSYAIAIKQLYASHYLNAALELRFLADDQRRAGSLGFYLLSIARSRNDGMTGFRGSFLRPIIRHRSRNAFRRYLEYVKRQVERASPDGP